VAGDLTVNGLKGDAATKYLEVGISASQIFSLANSGISVYCPEAYNAATLATDVGAYDAAALDISLLALTQAANTIYFSSYNNGGGAVTFANAAALLGFFSGNRTGGAASALYRASSTFPWAVVASSGGAGGNPANITQKYFALGRNANGVPDQFDTRRVSFIALHDGLNTADGQNLFNAVQALRVALGGGSV
jgi:hypothetical protein